MAKKLQKIPLESPKLGQEPLNLKLKEYCKKFGIKPPSASTLARIIKTEDLFMTVKRSFFLCKDRKIGDKKATKEKKLRIKGYKAKQSGDLVQMDSITIFLDGIRRYVITGIDFKTRFGFAFAYKSLTSRNAKDFMKVAPFSIKAIQTDNGSEFKKQKYSPFLSNAYVERFNRTLKDHYIEWHFDEILEPDEFNKGLMNYLIYYNTQNPTKLLINLLLNGINSYQSKMSDCVKTPCIFLFY